MPKNNPQSVDRSYKFMYKILEVNFHRYLYHHGEKIEFIDTEISPSGKRKDICVKVDGNIIQITEFIAKPLYRGKLADMHDYHDSERIDPQNQGLEIRSSAFSIANPKHGTDTVKIDENITFHVNTFFTKNRNSSKVLNKIIYKTITQEELSKFEAIDLLILPDMDIEMPIKALMKIIIVLIGKSFISDLDFKKKIILCKIKVLERFFTGNELSEMIEMLKLESENPEIQRVIKKYGQGFDIIYFDGKADGFEDGKKKGFNDGKEKGFKDGKLEVAKNLLKNGTNELFVAQNTEISIKELL